MDRIVSFTQLPAEIQHEIIKLLPINDRKNFLQFNATEKIARDSIYKTAYIGRDIIPLLHSMQKDCSSIDKGFSIVLGQDEFIQFLVEYPTFHFKKLTFSGIEISGILKIAREYLGKRFITYPCQELNIYPIFQSDSQLFDVQQLCQLLPNINSFGLAASLNSSDRFYIPLQSRSNPILKFGNLTFNERLEELVFQLCPLDYGIISRLRINELKSLKALYILNNRRLVIPNLDMLNGMSNLKTLVIHSIERISSSTLDFSSLSVLRKLKLTNIYQMGDISYMLFPESLTDIDLSGSFISQNVLSSFKYPTSLIKFRIDSISITNEDLNNMPRSLLDLDISYCERVPSHYDFTRFSGLEVLNLNGDNSVEPHNCKFPDSLLELYVRDTNFQFQGISEVRFPPHLKVLEFGDKNRLFELEKVTFPDSLIEFSYFGDIRRLDKNIKLPVRLRRLYLTGHLIHELKDLVEFEFLDDIKIDYKVIDTVINHEFKYRDAITAGLQ